MILALPVKKTVSESFTLDTYSGNTLNLNQLIGYYITFKHDELVAFYVGTSWAITGQYGGYGTVSFGPQFSFNVLPNITLSMTHMIGIGGHAALPLGNGLLTWFNYGVNYLFTQHHAVTINYGSMDYFNGQYNVSVFSIGFKYSYDIFFK